MLVCYAFHMCVRACVRACVRVCVCVFLRFSLCVCVCTSVHSLFVRYYKRARVCVSNGWRGYFLRSHARVLPCVLSGEMDSETPLPQGGFAFYLRTLWVFFANRITGAWYKDVDTLRNFHSLSSTLLLLVP